MKMEKVDYVSKTEQVTPFESQSSPIKKSDSKFTTYFNKKLDNFTQEIKKGKPNLATNLSTSERSG